MVTTLLDHNFIFLADFRTTFTVDQRICSKTPHLYPHLYK